MPAGMPASEDGPDSQSDEALMASVRIGDREAFRLLVTRHIDRIVGLARRVVGSGEAEDIAQDIFLKLWIRRDQWTPGTGAFRTWLYRVALNRCIDYTRKQTTVSLDETAEMTDPARSPLEAYGASEAADRLREAVLQLPERQRIAITLYYNEDLTAAQVATVMDLNLNAVESLLKRGRKRLREILE